MKQFLAVTTILLIAFSPVLYLTVKFGLAHDLYSYLILIPAISLYLAWQERDRLNADGPRFGRLLPTVLSAATLLLLVALGITLLAGFSLPLQDRIALGLYALVFALAGNACLWLSRDAVRALAFPIGLLVFFAPLPTVVEQGLESFLQHGSALAAHGMLEVSGMPVYREKTFFRLPDFNMEVAPECSGIRSTLALFITSLVGGQILLRTPWKRAVLALVVLPIALLRNGFRVFTIGQLCVQIGPEMIDSWIHRQGGPVFFALSLIPFSIILFLLYRSDHRSGRPRAAQLNP